MTNTETGVSGLVNLGNTCFMNSCLQILAHTNELNNEINKLSYIRSNALFIEWVRLNKLLSNSNKVVSPNNFHKQLQIAAIKKKNINFIGYNQNDAEEFLIFIFDIFHETCKVKVDMCIKGDIMNKMDKVAYNCYKEFIRFHKNDYSLFIKLFYHMTVITNYSKQTNEMISQRFQSNFILEVPIPTNKKNITLYDCLDSYFEDGLLTGDNAIMNEKTGQKIDVVQKTSMWSPPSILIVTLKRFSYTGKKNVVHIDFPLNNLELDKYICGYNNRKKYSLYGICNHSGVLAGGHYTSYVKVNHEDWYLFNDAMVSKVENINQNLITPKAYCLFYRLEN